MQIWTTSKQIVEGIFCSQSLVVKFDFAKRILVVVCRIWQYSVVCVINIRNLYSVPYIICKEIALRRKCHELRANTPLSSQDQNWHQTDLAQVNFMTRYIIVLLIQLTNVDDSMIWYQADNMVGWLLSLTWRLVSCGKQSFREGSLVK